MVQNTVRGVPLSLDWFDEHLKNIAWLYSEDYLVGFADLEEMCFLDEVIGFCYLYFLQLSSIMVLLLCVVLFL